MAVRLEAIKFNHNPSAATHDALSIRQNASQSIVPPEWRDGMTQAEESPAAYAIEPTRENTLTIQAKIARTDPHVKTVEVRAIDPGVPSVLIGLRQLQFLGRLLSPLLQFFFQVTIKNVLGEVAPRSIKFGDLGATDFETFELRFPDLWDRGVGIHTVTWQWQYRLAGNASWTDFATTHHRVYTVLDVPTSPWEQMPVLTKAWYVNTQLPWTDVLDYACQWASRTSTLDEAATRVTHAAYNLGPTIVEYDCPGYGSVQYALGPSNTLGPFNCTAFLERLRGGIGLGQYVNCIDCATIVITFANILGCDLWTSEMSPQHPTVSEFELNPILAIGSSTWQPACGWSGFSYHVVAWKGACTSNDGVFDACLQVDGDADPTTAPQTPLQPTNLRFGFPGDGDYRDRLATPAGRPYCEPRPAARIRLRVV